MRDCWQSKAGGCSRKVSRVAGAQARGLARPPKPPRRSVLRLPSTGGTSMPPAKASQARAPPCVAPRRSVPQGSSTGRPPWSASSLLGRYRIALRPAAPQSAIRTGSSNCRVGPCKTSSSTAASSLLPTSRLANVAGIGIEHAAACDAQMPPAFAAEVLHGGMQARSDNPRRHAVPKAVRCGSRASNDITTFRPWLRPSRRRQQTSRDRPARSKDGASRAGSNSTSGVRPISRQPPGLSRG